MLIKNKPDFWSGIMFAAIGTAFAVGARHYPMGTSARMGPGYFPFWLGLVLAVLGLAVALRATSFKTQAAELEKFDWKVVVIVVGSVALCGLVLDSLGVYISVFLLVFLSSFASHEFSWKISLVNGVFLAVFVWLAFIKGLGLIFPLWPGFFGN